MSPQEMAAVLKKSDNPRSYEEIADIVSTFPNGDEIEKRQHDNHKHDVRYITEPNIYQEDALVGETKIEIVGYCRHCNELFKREPTEEELKSITTYMSDNGMETFNSTKHLPKIRIAEQSWLYQEKPTVEEYHAEHNP